MFFWMSSCIQADKNKHELQRSLADRIRQRDLLLKEIQLKQDSLSKDSLLFNQPDFVLELSGKKAELEGLELQIRSINKLLDSLERK